MLSEEELDELYKEILHPYTQAEFQLHSHLRPIKSWLEIVHAHNYDLIDLVQETNRYLFEDGPKPERKLWVMLRPGSNNDNAACARIHEIARFFAQFEYGEAPRFPIVVFAARSAMTLAERLEELFFHESICDINHHIKEFVALVAQECVPRLSKEEFGTALMTEADAIIAAFAAYSKALAAFTHEREAMLKQGEKVVKVELVRKSTQQKFPRHTAALGKGKQTAFMKKQRHAFDAYLEKHPITPSCKRTTLAFRCWLEHKNEWDKAAASGAGYSSYKSLAQSV